MANEQRLSVAASSAIEKYLDQVDQAHNSKTREFSEQLAARYVCDDHSIRDADFNQLADKIELIQFGKISKIRN